MEPVAENFESLKHLARMCVNLGVNYNVVSEGISKREVSLEAVIQRLERAAELRDFLGPDIDETPVGMFAATPPGRTDARLFDQDEFWVDILGTIFRISDRVSFSTEKLKAEIEELRSDASRYKPVVTGRAALEWLEDTVLFRALLAEFNLRKQSGGIWTAKPRFHSYELSGEFVGELTPETRGSWLVSSEGTQHLWDLDTGVYARFPTSVSLAGEFDYDAELQRITRVEVWPQVGRSFVVFCDDPAFPDSIEQWRRSSWIKNIERLNRVR